GGGEAGFARRARLDVVGAADVADDHEVGAGDEVGRVEPRHEADAPALERGAHRGVEGRVRAGDVVARGLEEAGERAHPGACDGDEVNVHARSVVERGGLTRAGFG